MLLGRSPASANDSPHSLLAARWLGPHHLQPPHDVHARGLHRAPATSRISSPRRAARPVFPLDPLSPRNPSLESLPQSLSTRALPLLPGEGGPALSCLNQTPKCKGAPILLARDVSRCRQPRPPPGARVLHAQPGPGPPHLGRQWNPRADKAPTDAPRRALYRGRGRSERRDVEGGLVGLELGR